MSCAKRHLPAVLQNESHLYLQEKDLRDFCKVNDIVFQVHRHIQNIKRIFLMGKLVSTQSYSSLGSADRPWRQSGSIVSGPPPTGHELLEHPTLRSVAARHPGKTPAQVALRWHRQMGGAVSVKSVTPSRIKENHE